MSAADKLISERATDPRYCEETWRLEYAQYPYLKNAPLTDLDIRVRALEANLVFLLSAARDAVPERGGFLSSWWWLKKWVQTLAEYELRKLAPPQSEAQPSVITEPPFAPKHPNECSFVVRYGERAWLQPMLEKGSVRLSPASNYQSDLLSSAQKDNELEKPYFSLGDRVRVTNSAGAVTPVAGDLRYARHANANYYALCSANEFDERLFPLFTNLAGEPADACIVVWDVDEFAARLAKASRSLDGWYFHHNPVEYFDPRRMEPRQLITAGMSKDFAFAYQREYRFIWMPTNGGEARDYLELSLGALGDIAGLFSPEGLHLAGRSIG